MSARCHQGNLPDGRGDWQRHILAGLPKRCVLQKLTPVEGRSDIGHICQPDGGKHECSGQEGFYSTGMYGYIGVGDCILFKSIILFLLRDSSIAFHLCTAANQQEYKGWFKFRADERGIDGWINAWLLQNLKEINLQTSSEVGLIWDKGLVFLKILWESCLETNTTSAPPNPPSVSWL